MDREQAQRETHPDWHERHQRRAGATTYGPNLYAAMEAAGIAREEPPETPGLILERQESRNYFIDPQDLAIDEAGDLWVPDDPMPPETAADHTAPWVRIVLAPHQTIVASVPAVALKQIKQREIDPQRMLRVTAIRIL